MTATPEQPNNSAATDSQAKAVEEQKAPLSKEEKAATRRYRLLAQLGFYGLFILLPVWFLLLDNQNLTLSLLKLGLFWLPLCYALPGILRNNAYTFAWCNFQVTFIFMHASTAAYLDFPTPWLASLELVFCTLMLIYGSLFARHRGRELGLKVPKLKDLK